ncbi:MAG: hypothetical protein HZC28_13610 [Spirochaetes bacterium]|nr:hypothetical protein [Spirochaetota bacterium]
MRQMLKKQSARNVSPLLTIITLCLIIPSTVSHAGTLKCSEKGITIEGLKSILTLEYPAEELTGGGKAKIADQTPSASGMTLRYDNGSETVVDLSKPDAIVFRFKNMPAGVKFRISMLIDFNFSEGGGWRIGKKSEEAFPALKPAKPHLFQGGSDELFIRHPDGRTLTFSFDVPCKDLYQQLQDNREWGWKTFQWTGWFTYGDEATATIKVTAGKPKADGQAQPQKILDRFGQDTKKDWAGKVRDESELTADKKADADYYSGLKQITSLDRFGGAAGSGARLNLSKTGFFHVEKKQGKWNLVDPDGNLFFHLGICSFGMGGDHYTYVEGREDSYEWLPGKNNDPFASAWHPDKYWGKVAVSFYLANVIRKYQKPVDADEFLARMIRRVRALGFNSAGAFGGASPVYKESSFPYVLSLPLGEWTLKRQLTGLRGFFDPFDELTVKKIGELFASSLPARADDPLLIGYFLENEQACEDIPRVIPGLKGDAPAKKRLVTMLEEKYLSIDRFNAAWNMNAASFTELAGRGLPVTTREASADMEAYTRIFLEEYYRVITTAFKLHDKNHMLLGNRWQPLTANSETLVSVAGKYMDIVSVNYYSYTIDRTFLDRLYKWSGERPFMLSEWHFSSPSDSGLPGGAKDVASQDERGLGYRAYVEQAAATGYIIGHEWFSLVDQARTGRFFSKYNGENGNIGLISVADRPWRKLTDRCFETHNRIYDVLTGSAAPYKSDIARFTTGAKGAQKIAKIMRVTEPIIINGATAGWPGVPPEFIGAANLVNGASHGGVNASYRLAWDNANLYILADVEDPTPMQNTRENGGLWAGDGIELFIGPEKIDDGGPLLFSDRQILLGAAKSNDGAKYYFVRQDRQPSCRSIVLPRTDGKGYIIEAAIPFDALGFTPKPGQTIRFDMAIDDSSDGKNRERQFAWNGTANNSGDRGNWGKAVFSE